MIGRRFPLHGLPASEARPGGAHPDLSLPFPPSTETGADGLRRYQCNPVRKSLRSPDSIKIQAGLLTSGSLFWRAFPMPVFPSGFSLFQRNTVVSVVLCASRPRSQRRDRNGFSPSSLLGRWRHLNFPPIRKIFLCDARPVCQVNNRNHFRAYKFRQLFFFSSKNCTGYI